MDWVLDALGGSKADLRYDVDRGFVTVLHEAPDDADEADADVEIEVEEGSDPSSTEAEAC